MVTARPNGINTIATLSSCLLVPYLNIGGHVPCDQEYSHYIIE